MLNGQPSALTALPDHGHSEVTGAMRLHLTGTFDTQTLHDVAAAINECLLSVQLVYWEQ